MSRTNLNRLAMFDAAARHLNFRLAAEELSLTQGAVAQQVRSLEAELGHKLFERHARGLSLTAVGRNYHVHIRRALDLIAEATRELSPKTNRITLSLPPSLASRWLISRLAEFQDSHPDIELNTNASEKLADFRTDGVDIAIRHGTTQADPELTYEPFADFRLVAVCAPSLAATIGTPQSLADLAHFKLIEDGHKSWSRMLDLKHLPTAPNMIKFSHSTLAIDAALARQGIALVPDVLVEQELQNGSLVAIWSGDEPDNSGYFIVYPKSAKRASKERDAVIAWLRDQRQHNG